MITGMYTAASKEHIVILCRRDLQVSVSLSPDYKHRAPTKHRKVSQQHFETRKLRTCERDVAFGFAAASVESGSSPSRWLVDVAVGAKEEDAIGAALGSTKAGCEPEPSVLVVVWSRPRAVRSG